MDQVELCEGAQVEYSLKVAKGKLFYVILRCAYLYKSTSKENSGLYFSLSPYFLLYNAFDVFDACWSMMEICVRT